MPGVAALPQTEAVVFQVYLRLSEATRGGPVRRTLRELVGKETKKRRSEEKACDLMHATVKSIAIRCKVLMAAALTDHITAPFMWPHCRQKIRCRWLEPPWF